MKIRYRIFFTRLLLSGFLLFCAAVYFGCTAAFSLLSPRQTFIMALIWAGCIRAVTAPLRYAQKRAKYDPDMSVFYYYDGLSRYGKVLGWDLLWLGCGGVALLPGLGCLVLWYLAMRAEMVFFAGVFLLCGVLLLSAGSMLLVYLDFTAYGCYNKDRKRSTRGK